MKPGTVRVMLLTMACLAVAPLARAETGFSTKATVVSVDLKAQTMSVRSLPQGANDKVKEYLVHWDDKSKFVKEGATWADPPTDITAESVAPGTAVYVSITDRFFNLPGQKNDKLWIDTLKVLRPGAR